MSVDRRRFVQLFLGGAATAAAAPAFVRDPAHAQAAPGPFGHGVASGDPLPDGVVIWTRVTPSAEATPGSGLGQPVAVRWAVGSDDALSDVVASGTVTTSADTDHTVKVDVRGLDPAATYWYRFEALGQSSPVGRTRTAPATDQVVDALRVGVVSCSDYQSGYFTAYRHLARRDDLDLVVHLGDYIYEYGPREGALGDRPADPAHEILTLADYRRRHALYKTDPDLVEAHRRFAWVTTIDDHEITNDTWAEGAENHDEGEGDYRARRAAGLQAYFEWMPIRPVDGTRIHRAFSYGPLADLIVLDERTYRSQQVEGLSGASLVTDPAVADPERTMLGAAQRDWLSETLGASTAQWKVVANSVMFAPLVIADLPDVPVVAEALQEVLGQLGLRPPVVLNADQWDGYQAEQRSLGARFGEVGGVVLLTGDIHSSWAAEIPADPGAYLPAVGGASNAVEFVTPAVTSSSFTDALAGVAPGAEALVELIPVLLATIGSWFKYFDGAYQGFGVFEVAPEAAQYDWFYVSDRRDPEATLVPGPSWRTPVGTNRLEAASALGPRPLYAPAPEAAPLPVGAPPTAPPGAAPDSIATLPDTGGEVPLALAALAAAVGLVAARAARVASEEPPRPSATTASEDGGA